MKDFCGPFALVRIIFKEPKMIGAWPSREFFCPYDTTFSLVFVVGAGFTAKILWALSSLMDGNTFVTNLFAVIRCSIYLIFCAVRSVCLALTQLQFTLSTSLFLRWITMVLPYTLKIKKRPLVTASLLCWCWFSFFCSTRISTLLPATIFALCSDNLAVMLRS